MSLSQGFKPILAGVATAILVAACGGSGATTAPSTAASSAPSAAASAAASVGPAEAYEVDVATDATVGMYLTGEDGKTLYLFAPDSSGKSTCNGSCAANWPPFLLSGGDTVKAGAGVTGTIATIKRDDGTTQVTINGLPLYYFQGDTDKGQLNGQGIGGKWYAASPAGTPTGSTTSASQAPAGSTAPKVTPCSGYYCP
jgi:predicted lipoprotein with Yx(FWY)xxD motif